MRRTFLILCIICLVVACNNLMAQDDKTSFDKNRKISEQLKNGTAPGMKFAPASRKRSTLKEPTAAEKSASVGKQLKNGTLPGSGVAKGGGGGGTNSRTTNARRSNTAGAKLPSDGAAGSGVKVPATNSQAPKIDQGGAKEVLEAPVSKPRAGGVKAADQGKKPAGKE